ncbi:ComEC/Rec2 family competence protein [Thermogemmatispora carboxidivorans]|uniref:ComEC/Rec2 family competence protein n=1 Tax=Thermogemmatispora carboxidivorans TaxID=1382306 RepID=UPI000699327E|nr:ComEC/Rec2 family competence protein [Thermogemmatispora carboxidivorans]
MTVSLLLLREALLRLRKLPLLVVCPGWLAGIVLADWLQFSPRWLLLPLLAMVLVTVVGWRRWERAGVLWLFLSALLAGAWRMALADPRHDPLAVASLLRSPAGTSQLIVHGEVSAPPTLEGHARRLTVSVIEVSSDGGLHWWPRHGEIAVLTSGTLLDDPYGPAYGDEVLLRGHLLPPASAGAPDLQALMAFPRLTVRRHGGNPLLALLYALRFQLAALIARVLPQPEAALLVAILLGLRTPALQPLTPLFNVTGTAHLIVPSGFKVTLLAGLLALPLQPLTRPKPDDWLLLPAQRRRSRRWLWLLCALQLLAIAAYTVLSGAGPAALRAGFMGALLVLAPRLGRHYHVYSALAATALVLSLVDPFVLWDSGFQLSFLGTLGIVLFTPLFARPLRRLERFPAGSLLVEALAVTLAAQVATLPVFALTFAQLSFVAPLANLLTVPLLELLLFLGAAICLLGTVCLPLALVVGWLAWFPLQYIIDAVALCARLPFAWLSTRGWPLSVPLAWGYYALLAGALGLGWRSCPALFVSSSGHSLPQVGENRPKPGPGPSHKRGMLLGGQLALALLLLLTTGLRTLLSQNGTGLILTVFALASPSGVTGPAVLVQMARSGILLIDGGPDATALAHVLDRRLPFWQRRIDWLVLSSPLLSHLTGLQDATSRFAIGQALDGGVLHPGRDYALWRRALREGGVPYQTLRQGQLRSLGPSLRLEVLWPPSPLHRGGDEARNNALVLRLVVPGLRLLLLGEAAQSSYALSGLLTAARSSSAGQVDVVLAALTAGLRPPPAFSRLLGLLHPSLLVVNMTTTRSPSAPPRPNSNGPGGGSVIVPPDVKHTFFLRAPAAFTVENHQTGWSFGLAAP